MNKYTKTFAQAMQEVRETKDSNLKLKVLRKLINHYLLQKLIDQETNKEYNDKIYKDVC